MAAVGQPDWPYKGAMTRKRVSASERRELILSAAVAMFAEHGYHRTLIGDVAAEAGISPPVLYDHFSSKQELYIAAVDAEAAEMWNKVASHLDPATEQLERRVRAVAAGLVAYVRDRPDGWQLLSSPPAGEPEIATAHARWRSSAVAVSADVTASDPDFTAPRGISRRLAASLFGELQWGAYDALMRWAGAHPRASTAALERAFMDFAWIGLARFRRGEHWQS